MLAAAASSARAGSGIMRGRAARLKTICLAQRISVPETAAQKGADGRQPSFLR